MKKQLFFLFALLAGPSCWAYTEGAFFAGLGSYSENVFNAVTKSDNRTASFLGETTYPLVLRYEKAFLNGASVGQFIAPQLSYTWAPRTSLNNAAKVTITNLTLQFGKNVGGNFDWYLGPGLIDYQIKGSGGTAVLNNGTSTATFYLPSGTSQIQKFTVNLGGSIFFGKSKIALDVIVENAFSETKRGENLMLSYLYQFGG